MTVRGNGGYPKEHQDVSRRTLLKGGGAALAGLTVLRVAGPAHAFGQSGGEVLPWLDQPPPNPVPDITGKLLQWEELDSFLTPADKFFYVMHYGLPDGLDEAPWRVGIGGLVAHPRSLTTGRHQSQGAPRGGFHIGMLGQRRHIIGLFLRRHWHCPLGRRATGAAAGGVGPPGRGE